MRFIKGLANACRTLRCGTAFWVLLVILAMLQMPSVAFSQTKSSASAPPVYRPVRVAYLEGGPFADYQKIFQGIVQQLAADGLIENGSVTIDPDTEQVQPAWNWLSENAGGKRLVFLSDGFYSAQWDQDKRREALKTLSRRIREKGDIDLILAMGTWAGEDLSNAGLPVPVVVASVTNAYESGIVSGIRRSGELLLVASIEPERYPRQIRLFHNIFGFKKLGIAYEDTASGRSSISLLSIESTAEELGVELVRCTDVFDVSEVSTAAERLERCHKELVRKGAEAVYLTLNRGLVPHHMPQVLEPLLAAKLPTFSQTGQIDVANGALLSISNANYSDEGAFSARQIKAIVEGAMPGNLDQRYEDSASLALNLDTARRIGWAPALEILVSVDEFFRNGQSVSVSH